jgi:hypothetical protein
VITFDGDRSMKRRWFAKKKLAQIHEIDVPGQAPMWEGFTFRVWQQGEIDGGRVTAPAGAVVACSSTSGIKLASADYWAGPFNGEKSLRVLFIPMPESGGDAFVFFDGATEEFMADAGWFTVPFSPSVSLSPFGLINGLSSGPDTVYVNDYSCAPVLIPNMPFESFRIMVADEMDYDLNENGIPEWHRQVFDRQPVFYTAAGEKMARRDGLTHHVESDINYTPRRIYQMPTASMFVMHHSAYLYDFVEGVKTVAARFDLASETRESITYSNLLPAGALSNGLRSILINSNNDGSCTPIGSYAFAKEGSQQFLHVVNATTYIWDIPETTSAAHAHYAANPSDEPWRLFYSWTNGETVSLVSAAQFIGLLDDLASVEVIKSGGGVNWLNAKRMLAQLAGAWPNNNFAAPYDSSMFHGHDGNVHTWTRAYGAVRFSGAGLFSESLIVPSEVSAESGVRPEISLVGDGPLYICVCNKPAVGVRAVCYGSPFDGWTTLAPPSEGITLKHVRLAGITETDITFIGVAQGVDIEDQPAYFFARIHHFFENGGEWKILGKLPFAVGDYDNFSCSLYGNTPDVRAMVDVPVYPPIVPQSPVGPYSLYTIGMP